MLVSRRIRSTTNSMPGKETPQSRQERRRQQRQQELARQKQQQQQSGKKRNLYVLGGGIPALVALCVVLFFVFKPSPATTDASQAGSPIDGIQCQAEMLAYHIHAHLTLYDNGKPVVVPADVGIPFSPAIANNTNLSPQGQPYCLYWLHTHDATGIVHIESPTQATYTLGQFFDIWHNTAAWDAQSTLASSAGVPPISASFIDALKSAKPGDVHAFVGGKPVSDYRGITLTAHKLITIELGTPVKPSTTHYTFPQGD